MTAATLRQAAALMRERAEAATYTCMPWGVDEIGAVWAQEADGQSVPISSRSSDENAEHIASWHPAVALAVADLLDEVADDADRRRKRVTEWTNGEVTDVAISPSALAVATTYLGSSRPDAQPCVHDTLGCGWREDHAPHTKVGDGRPCCGWPPDCQRSDGER